VHVDSKGKGIVTVPWPGDGGRCVALHRVVSVEKL
jgi:hypothetical protein